MTVQLGAALAVLAQTVPQPPPGEGPEWGKASPVGLVVVILLVIITVLLIKSMAGRIRGLPTSFDRSSSTSDADGPGGADRAADDRSGSDSSSGGRGFGGSKGGDSGSSGGS